MFLRNEFRIISIVIFSAISAACGSHRPATSPEDAIAARKQNQQGLVAFQARNLERARILFEKAAEIDPNEAEYPNNVGMVYLQSTDPQAALEQFNQAIEL
ncbi:MAG: tetratricopeptide repeat protein, partial [Leptospirales bacterium]